MAAAKRGGLSGREHLVTTYEATKHGSILRAVSCSL